MTGTIVKIARVESGEASDPQAFRLNGGHQVHLESGAPFAARAARAMAGTTGSNLTGFDGTRRRPISEWTETQGAPGVMSGLAARAGIEFAGAI